MKKKFIALTALVMLLVISTGSRAYAQTTLPTEVGKSEVPTELTMEEYLQDVDQFYQSHPELVITVDLANPNGIDLSLLPEDARASIKPGLLVVAYRETVRKGGKAGLPCPRPELMAGIGCKTNDGSRDLTTSSTFGSVKQFARTIALKYENYSRCTGVNCFGWEVDKQYMYWTRSLSSWNVKNGVMLTYIEAENYCTTSPATLNYGSSTIQPTWSGNQSTIYSISGFPNVAYVPWPGGYSYSQGDIYQGTTLKYDNAREQQTWPRY